MSARQSRTRKPRRQGRRPATRESLPRVRIVCEAAKTEPGYFSALARDFDLPNVSIRSPKRGQWGPAGITTTVQQQSEQDFDPDEIWCVLDHDERDTEIEDFRSWLEQQSNENADATKIRAAISTPCFEYSLLLHFTFTDKPFQGTPGGLSACQQVIRELETYIEGYRKDRWRDLRTLSRTASHRDQEREAQPTIGAIVLDGRMEIGREAPGIEDAEAQPASGLNPPCQNAARSGCRAEPE